MGALQETWSVCFPAKHLEQPIAAIEIGSSVNDISDIVSCDLEKQCALALCDVKRRAQCRSANCIF